MDTTTTTEASTMTTMTTTTNQGSTNIDPVYNALCIIDTHAMKLGEGSVADSEKYVAAYQYLIDTAIISFLKGHYRDEADELIAAGFCITK